MTLSFLTLPLSTNQLYRVVGNRSIISARGRTNKEAIGWEARAQYRGKPLAGPLAVQVSIFWPDCRRHDVDNIKILLDSSVALSGLTTIRLCSFVSQRLMTKRIHISICMSRNFSPSLFGL